MLKFIFINAYAFVLLLLGVAIILIPINIVMIILKCACAVLCIVGAVNIFMQWKRKNRMIKILLKRNADEFNPDSFDAYMETFCSQLVVAYVLIKIGHGDKFAMLFRKWWKEYWKEE